MEPLRAALGARPGKELAVDGVRLAYDDEGRGPALVCLHAVGHGARDFADLRERLRGRCRVLALDWPGHGRSGEDDAPASAARYAELLGGFVDALGIESPILLGNSIGGAAAIRCAASRPGALRGLVLVDSAGLDRVDALARAVTRAMARLFRAGARGARWYPRAFALYYARVLPAPAAHAQRERIVAAGREMAPRLAEAWASFGEPDADLRELAAGLAVPALVCWAERDLVIQLRRNLPAIGRMRSARLERFAGGHAAFLEEPEAFARALARFLDELGVASHAGGEEAR